MKKLISCLLLLFIVSSVSQAAILNNDTIASGNWTNPAIWSQGYVPGTNPANQDKARFSAGTILTVDSTVSTFKLFGFGGELHVQSGAEINMDDFISIAENASSKMIMTGGTINVTAPDKIKFGKGGNSATGTTITGGVINSGPFDIGFKDSSNVIDFGGTAVANLTWLKMDGSGTNDFNMTGGTINGYDILLATATNSINLTGGEINLTYDAFQIKDTAETWADYKARIVGYNIGTYTVDDIEQTITIVPEPATLALLGIGGVLLRKRK